MLIKLEQSSFKQQKTLMNTHLYILLQELLRKSSLKLKLHKMKDFPLPPPPNTKGIYALPPKQCHANIQVYHILFLHPAVA